MSMDPYLARLTSRLAAGLEQRPRSFLDRHARYVKSCQNEDGGFGGRDPNSDLYYTSFALRSLAMLGELDEATASRAADYLRLRIHGHATIIDFFSFLYSVAIVQIATGVDVLEAAPPDWPDRVASLLESFRTPDGGYGKSAGALYGSTYQTFLTALCYELLGRPLPNDADLVRFVKSRQREDGGYVEIPAMRRSGTNPTAAAIGTLQMLHALEPVEIEQVRRLLAASQSPEGGLLANGRVPLADLLSTFTGYWTLAEIEAPSAIDCAAAAKYVQSLERPEGGFHGGSWDSGFDVEYTFYGLGASALLDP